MRILIVDDSLAVRSRLAAMLREAPRVSSVREASEAHEALSLLRAWRPDALVLDIHLPGTNGLEVLAQVRQDGNCPLVVVLTNDASEHYRKRCLEQGADFFFDKSRDFDRAVDVLSNYERPTSA